MDGEGKGDKGAKEEGTAGAPWGSSSQKVPGWCRDGDEGLGETRDGDQAGTGTKVDLEESGMGMEQR